MKSANGFFIPFVKLAGPFWNSRHKGVIRRDTILFIVLTILQIGVAVEITEWSASLFNSLEQRSMPGLQIQIVKLLLIFLANMVITTFHLVLKRRLIIGWRRWLTDRLIGQWMDKGHHYQLSHIEGDHDNPDGRIAEDIRIATEDAISLAHSLFYCLLMLGSFATILWELSGHIYIWEFALPGHLVLVAVIYASAASTLGWMIGRPLVKATNHNQSAEANFRFSLIKARENSQAIALIYGEENEQARFRSLFHDIVLAFRQQTRAWSHITLFTSGYSVLSMAFPILISAPRFIVGSITLGALMQSAQAFQHLASALSWPVDNMAGVAKWRASVERVLSLADSLNSLAAEPPVHSPDRILITRPDHSVLVFKELCVKTPQGKIIIPTFSAVINAGERVLIDTDATTGAKLFKVIAGLWPWGSGEVELPDGEPMFFMPPHPYLPTASLREAICYPKTGNSFPETTLTEAMNLAGLSTLIPQLDDVDSWDKALSREQQQRLGFVRLFINQPKWVLLQEAFDSLDPESETQMLQVVCEQLPQATILTVTNHCTLEGPCGQIHHRWITL